MALPENFGEWEHLQSLLIRTQNRIVRDDFTDLGGDDWDPDITIPRGSLRVACTLKDNDTVTITLLRLITYYFVMRKARDLQPPVYGSTIWNEGTARKHRPQIMLFFQEDFNDVDPGYSPLTGEISFRLMNETSTSITETNMNTWANKIKTTFASPSGFVWKKGREMSTYTDWEKGYQLQLLVKDKAEGKRIVEQVLDIQNHTPDWTKFNHQQNDNPPGAYPILPGSQMILAKSRKKKRIRPIGDVRFQYGVLKIDGLPNPVPLCDRSGIFRDAIEVVY